MEEPMNAESTLATLLPTNDATSTEKEQKKKKWKMKIGEWKDRKLRKDLVGEII